MRQQFIALYQDAVAAGARRDKAAAELELPTRTLRRWLEPDGQIRADGRPQAIRPAPANRLSEAERKAIVVLCNRPEYASLPPSQIVPRLADQGEYLASESSFYRVLKAEDQLHHRGRAKAPVKRAAPTTQVATGPNQVWTWDISYMPSTVRGLYWFLYAVLDIYSRKLVAWEVHTCESGELASALIQRAILREQCLYQPLVLHADNGAPMTSSTLQAKLKELGVTPSHSRPRVSNDNPFSESLFRTVKYCPQWPSQGFAALDDAQRWMLAFERFYNQEHRHSGIRFVTPVQRHSGQDAELLAKRDAVYRQAREKHPERWSGSTRNWTPQGPVTLNPDRQLKDILQAA